MLWAVMSLNGGRYRTATAFVGSLSRYHFKNAPKLEFAPSQCSYYSRGARFPPRNIHSNENKGFCRLFSTTSSSIEELNEKIKVKGEEIRQLKADGIDKKDLAPHVEELLALKAQLPSEDNKALDELNKKIAAKGDEIRQLKADGIDKEALAPHVEELLALKAQLPSDNAEEKKNSSPKKKEGKPAKQNNNKKGKPADEPLSESEIKLNRLAKVESMREANVEPFEYTFDATTTAAQLTATPGELELLLQQRGRGWAIC